MAVLSRELVRRRFMAAAAKHGWTTEQPRRDEAQEEEEEANEDAEVEAAVEAEVDEADDGNGTRRIMKDDMEQAAGGRDEALAEGKDDEPEENRLEGGEQRNDDDEGRGEQEQAHKEEGVDRGRGAQGETREDGLDRAQGVRSPKEPQRPFHTADGRKSDDDDDATAFATPASSPVLHAPRAAVAAGTPSSAEASFVDAMAYADDDLGSQYQVGTVERSPLKGRAASKGETPDHVDSPAVRTFFRGADEERRLLCSKTEKGPTLGWVGKSRHPGRPPPRRTRARVIASSDESDCDGTDDRGPHHNHVNDVEAKSADEHDATPSPVAAAVRPKAGRIARRGRVVLSDDDEDDEDEEEQDNDNDDVVHDTTTSRTQPVLSRDGYEYDDFVVPAGSDDDEDDDDEQDLSDNDDDSDGESANSDEEASENTPPSRTLHRDKAPLSASNASLRQFKATREQDARDLYATFNRTIFGGQLPATMTLTWSVHLNTTAGRTHLTEAIQGMARTREASIELSTKVLDRPERLRSTLAHEMCHAAAWIIDGVNRPPHGSAFRRWAAKVARHAKMEVTTCHRYEIVFKHTYVCTNPACGETYGRHSKSIDVRTARCGRCRGPLELKGKTLANGSVPQARKENGARTRVRRGARTPTAFAAYVRAHLARMRASDPSAPHKTIMARLAEQYRNERHQASATPDPEALPQTLGALKLSD